MNMYRWVTDTKAIEIIAHSLQHARIKGERDLNLEEYDMIKKTPDFIEMDNDYPDGFTGVFVWDFCAI